MSASPTISKLDFSEIRELHNQFLDSASPLFKINQRAMERFIEIGFPSKKTEAFNAFNPEEFNQQSFDLAPQLKDQSPGNLEDIFEPGERSILEILNGKLTPELSHPGPEFDQFEAKMLSAFEQNKKVLNYLKQSVENETDPYALLNLAFLRDAVIIRVPQNIQLSNCIQLNIRSLVSGQSLSAGFTRIIVQLEQNSQSRLACLYFSEGTKNLTNTVVDFLVDQNARGEAMRFESGTGNSLQLVKMNLHLKRDSSLHSITAFAGSRLMRSAIEAHLLEPGIELSLEGFSILNKELQSHHHIQVYHHAPHCTSRQFFRNVLMDQSKCSIDSTVLVKPGADGTDSRQLFNNLMLSDEAKASAKPILIIDTDDVQCSHGSTTGKLDENALFYLLSRGLSENDAQQILTRAFVLDILKSFPAKAMRQSIDHRLLSRLDANHE